MIYKLFLEGKNPSRIAKQLTENLDGLYAVLNDEAKRIFDSKYSINNVFQLIQRGYLNAIPDMCNEIQIIESYFEKILKESKARRN